jgi:formamidopyrimidine-DNA glycosylase
VPELPEVETIARGLRPALVGRTIVRVDVRERRLREPIAADFAARLTGRRIVGVDRHAKFLLVALDDDARLLVHLGMSGRLTLGAAARPAILHDHVVLDVGDGATLVYNDPRRFGRLAVIAADRVAAETVPGVDALDPALTADWLRARARGRRTSVKALLMDQRHVGGLGNIYVSEICHRAGVRPRRAARTLTRADCARLVVATRAVLDDAVANGGSSISDYRDGFDRFGSYQERHAVYDRRGLPCRTCGTPIRAAVVVGRSTFWCPTCQR